MDAASANKIVTQPGTATGSIGIACLDLNLAPAFKKAGINLDSVSVGRYQSPGTPWFWLVEKTSDDVCWFNAFKDRSVCATVHTFFAYAYDSCCALRVPCGNHMLQQLRCAS